MNHLHDKVIVLGVSGGIAAYKACDLASKLRQEGAEVTVVMTASAQQFVTPLTFQSLTHRPVITGLFTPVEEWEIEHIAVAQRASLAVIAPATANIISKIACGIADDFLTAFVLATRAPIVVCPAMNCEMYANTIVQENIARLQTRGFHIIEPEEGSLACGDIGKGRLAKIETILERIHSLLGKTRDFEATKVLITAGPTHEPIDPVRYITNPSTGKMGYALAQAARERGAHVILVSGPVNLRPPAGVETINVKTAEEMADAVRKKCDDCRVIIGAAAVSDYAPEQYTEQKIKKSPGAVTLSLVPTTDIMAEMGKRRTGNQVLVGFSVETQDIEKNSKEKLKRKNLDLIVCNDITQPGAGFATDTNIVTILDTKGGAERLPKLSKLETAHRILDRIHSLL